MNTNNLGEVGTSSIKAQFFNFNFKLSSLIHSSVFFFTAVDFHSNLGSQTGHISYGSLCGIMILRQLAYIIVLQKG